MSEIKSKQIQRHIKIGWNSSLPKIFLALLMQKMEVSSGSLTNKASLYLTEVNKQLPDGLVVPLILPPSSLSAKSQYQLSKEQCLNNWGFFLLIN